MRFPEGFAVLINTYSVVILLELGEQFEVWLCYAHIKKFIMMLQK